MLDNIQIATPLSGNENFHYIVQTVREELERIDPKRLLIYLFDTVDDVLLDNLAEQFDMLGTNGWILADTTEQKRELLKSAYVLHAVKGTPGGIREVAKRLGFQDIIISENSGAPEGAANPWAYFTVDYVLTDDRSLPENSVKALAGLIDRYKNARSILADFNFEANPIDVINLLDVVTVEIL